jgi:hypothetical protein
MAEIPLSVLAARARAQVAAVANDPQGRYELRAAFYAKYGDGTPDLPRGYGESELAFMDWEIRRGVLDALPVGSPWWRKVNGEFLYLGQLAMLVYEAGCEDPVPSEVQFWLDYIKCPSADSWYRAHNASIVRGYLDSIDEAKAESSCEQLFMNEVLYRLLYAEALAIGWAMGELGEIVADPRLFAVSLITQMTALYPIHYPITPEDERNVEHLGTNPEDWIADVLDLDIILPHITELYALVAGIVDQPALERAIRDGVPIYPELTPPAQARLLAIGEALARQRALRQPVAPAPAAGETTP